MPSALSRQLLVIWALVAVASLGMAGLLLIAWQQTGSVQVAEARQSLSADCNAIVHRYRTATPAARAASSSNGLLDVVLQLVLEDAVGMEGGAWERGRGFTAYAYPTYEGSGAKTDVPVAERGNIATVAEAAIATGQARTYTRQGDRETVLITACPLDATRSVWTMTRLPRAPGRWSGWLTIGLSIPLALVLVSAGGLLAIMRRWRRKLSAVEGALMHASEVPVIPPTGSPEVDRLAAAVVAHASRLAESRRQAEALENELRRHDRLATLGRMTATVAHEIRNPIATMRLAAENALAQASESRDAGGSLAMVLNQVNKLDGLVESLLGMVQPMRVRLADTDLGAWLDTLLHDWPHETLTVHRAFPNGLHWRIDADQMHRAVENLLRNAFEHDATQVVLSIEQRDAMLHVHVSNPGEPLPDDIRDRLFEPFVSGRPNGNGLGLALVNEIALAHGGAARYVRDADMHRFIMDIPWHAS
ncbi:ATP-binding protein [Luteibacter sp. CQ10]|uniref:ATP-binding protein n=1 Tax=Luteibacter sp. CQ10 TaxID=2805821 RepID=UPI0034A3FFCD